MLSFCDSGTGGLFSMERMYSTVKVCENVRVSVPLDSRDDGTVLPSRGVDFG
jgi:hypothetical protein